MLVKRIPYGALDPSHDYFLKKAFDKLGKAITKGGSNLGKFVTKKVAKKTVKKYHLTDKAKADIENAVQNSKEFSAVYKQFGTGTKDLARNAAIALATLGAGAAVSAVQAGQGIAAAGQGISSAGQATSGLSAIKTGIGGAITAGSTLLKKGEKVVTTAGKIYETGSNVINTVKAMQEGNMKTGQGYTIGENVLTGEIPNRALAGAEKISTVNPLWIGLAIVALIGLAIYLKRKA